MSDEAQDDTNSSDLTSDGNQSDADTISSDLADVSPYHIFVLSDDTGPEPTDIDPPFIFSMSIEPPVFSPDGMEASGGEPVSADDTLPYKDWMASASGMPVAGLSRGQVLRGHAQADTLRGGDAADTLRGGEGNDRLSGESGDDRLNGQSGDDRLYGKTGDDRLIGASGKDILNGGAGSDSLTGGHGDDQFIFRRASDSDAGRDRDVITDFRHGHDEIVLKAIDADETTGGNQHFDFIASAHFSGTAGELRFGHGILSGDTDGDGRSDFQIAVTDVHRLHESDFML